MKNKKSMRLSFLSRLYVHVTRPYLSFIRSFVFSAYSLDPLEMWSNTHTHLHMYDCGYVGYLILTAAASGCS